MAKKQPKDKNFKRDDMKDKFDKKSNDKSRSREKRWAKDEKSFGRNDVGWYTPDVQLLNDAGRWPYSRPVGTPLSRTSLLGDASSKDYAVPGMAVAHAYLTIGDCKNGQSAANVAANAVYTFVRHVNSGSRNYDANDLMLYITAIDSIYSYITWVTRAYCTVPMYAQMNKYLPEALGTLQHIDLSSIRDNMANFRAKFNSLLLKVGTLVVPDSMPIFRRHAFLFQNYYSEGPNIKDQMYFYTLENVYKFQLDSNGAGMLKNVNLADYYNGAGMLDASALIQILEDMITPIFNDEDFNIMSGDILKAYDGRILSLMLLNENLVAQPINNVTFLEQFKNIKCLAGGFGTLSDQLNIYQDSNKEFLYTKLDDFAIGRSVDGIDIYLSLENSYTPYFHIMADQWSRPLVLTTELTDVTPEVNMLNTRMVTSLDIAVDTTAPSGLKVNDAAFGSEIVTGVEYAFHDASWALMTFKTSTVMVYATSVSSHLALMSELMNDISSFRFHPEISFVGWDNAQTPAGYVGSGLPVLGIDNFTTIDFDHVRTLHDVAILGEFNVPRLAVVK